MASRSDHQYNLLYPDGSSITIMRPVPKRIQRKRTKGWRMPANTVYVGRPTPWGNPYDFAEGGREEAVRLFRQHVADRPTFQEAIRGALRGRNLACWCPLVDGDGSRTPCHGDVLLEIANS